MFVGHLWPYRWGMTPDPYESALADEILAEAKRKRLSHKYLQSVTETPQRTWGNYFVQKRNAIPSRLVFQIAQVLGVSASELIRRAEASVGAPAFESEALTRDEQGVVVRGRRRALPESDR